MPPISELNLLKEKIFSISSPEEFEATALEVFQLQATYNLVYKNYISFLKIDVAKIKSVAQIPFLPISFFKTKEIILENEKPKLLFESSGTTGLQTSRHFVADEMIYKKSLQKGFEKFYGKAKDWCFVALLPSYLERQNSSLVFMMNELMKLSNHPSNGFYLDDFEKLFQTISENEIQKQKTFFIGVTYALLDFAEKFPLPLHHTTIVETGGMKGRKKELTRESVHQQLQKSFQTKTIHAEYGMTELLSQAYSKGNGIFETPPWMKISIRDLYDPLQISPPNQTGCINVIDLANLYSCSFIATDDLGVVHNNGSFEVVGRADNADIRGCNLMIN